MQQSYGYAGATVANAASETRERFIARTYNHLFAAILAFAGIEIALFKLGIAEQIAVAILGSRTMWLVVLGGFIVVGWVASRVAHTATSLAAQYAALAGYVIVEALIFVPLLYIADVFAPGAIRSAAIVTFIGFAGLTAIAFITKKDFSFLRGLLLWGGVVALLVIVAGLIFSFQLGVFFSVAMVGLAGAAILYDTSNVLHHYSEDRYVGAALELFASVALMFWYVLRIFISSRD
jgi:FtsH-binding integral membrane protein